MKKLKPLMFVGTASDVGKSIITTGLCRILKQDGYSPAPFKAQNISLNSFATPDGYEIAKAQAIQAEAAGIPSHGDMNPVLLKPNNDACQLIVNGRVVDCSSKRDNLFANNKEQLFKEALAAYSRLQTSYNPVVIEGAGSICELNLKHLDIANMRMALAADASTYLVTNIERGGVFGSVYGTIQLLTPEERNRIKGIIINKFRGDINLFAAGKRTLEELTQLPVVGIVPYSDILAIEEEDSVSLINKKRMAVGCKVNVAVILLKHISNFTDFVALEQDERVHVFYTNNPTEIQKADIIIIPGTKNTTADLIEIKINGTAQAIVQMAAKGKTVIGICGGFQMMGHIVEDPFMVEGEVVDTKGLELLPVKTVIRREKITKQCQFLYKHFEAVCEGYEIHMGETTALAKNSPLNRIVSDRTEGYLLNDKCWGTYVHGIFDNAIVRDDILKNCEVTTSSSSFDYKEFRERQYNLLAEHLRRNLDMQAIYHELKK